MDMKIIGVHACQMVFKKRPQDIVKIFLTKENVKNFSHALKVCADQKKSYKITTEEDLEKVSGSLHNEGVCFYVKKRPIHTSDAFLEKLSNKRTCIVALENVENPHNIGALMRVCANFGVTALLLQNAKNFQNAAVFRVSEGGAEWLELLDCQDMMKSIDKFKRSGFSVYTTSSHIGRPPHKVSFPDKTMFVFGSEKLGISRNILNKGDAILSIPSTGHVESLNVTCAASIILNAYYGK